MVLNSCKVALVKGENKNAYKQKKRKWKQAITMITASALVSASSTLGEAAFANAKTVAVKTVEDSSQTISKWNQKSSVKTMASSSELVYGDYTYKVSGNEATITRYKGSGGNVVIPGVIGE